MQFIELHVGSKSLMEIVQAIPELWWKNPYGQIQSLFGYLHGGGIDLMQRLGTEISVQISNWIRKEIDSAKAGLLINCTVSDTRLVTFNIPLEGVDNFYQLRVEPLPEPDEARIAKKRFKVTMFYPGNGAFWYAVIAATLTYKRKMGKEFVCLDSEWISIKAWNAICALCVATGGDISEAMVLMDMAKDGLI